jgi:predicted  nucleic acid-binding Zn-ribbon protein
MTREEAWAALRDADRWIDRVSAQRGHLPEQAELDEIESQLSALSRELRTLEEAKAPLAASLAELESQANALRARLGELRAESNSPSLAPRDLEAVQREIDQVAGTLNGVEDRGRTHARGRASRRTSAAIRQRAAPLVERRRSLGEDIAALTATLDEEIASLRSSREPLADALAPDDRKRYDAALARAGVSGAATVVDGGCDGCRIALAPLDLDRFRNRGETLFECPECGRILLGC